MTQNLLYLLNLIFKDCQGKLEMFVSIIER